MDICKGVYVDKRKNGELFYRASFTFKNKHIALGNYDDQESAELAYKTATIISKDYKYEVHTYGPQMGLAFEKYIIIINYRDNGMYFSNPIYVRKHYFSYFLSENEELKFSTDDLFYYMNHKICRRGGHLYVNDYGMQVSLGARYGIKNYAVINKDYRFINGDIMDYRYENLEILNIYNGVEVCNHDSKKCYKTRIHMRSNIVVGYYDSALVAAIAYNKAVDCLNKMDYSKKYDTNYVEEVSAKKYADIYSEIEIDVEKLKKYC